MSQALTLKKKFIFLYGLRKDRKKHPQKACARLIFKLFKFVIFTCVPSN